MRTLLVALIATFIALITPTPPVKAPTVRYPAPGTAHQVIEATKQWTVLISGEGWDGWDRGTGVLLDDTHVLTCYHVASMDVDQLWVYTYPAHILTHGKMVYADYKKDLAILELDTPALLT